MAEHESTPATSTAAKRIHPSQHKTDVEKKGQRPVRQSKRANIPDPKRVMWRALPNQGKPDAYEIITETEFKKQYEYPRKA